MAKHQVTGIGGFFFRSKDPEKLAEWYRDSFGQELMPTDQSPWLQQPGPTVFAPFPHDTDYLGDPAKQWMLNLRVLDLDATLDHLQKRGIEVKKDPTDYPYGRFAHLTDPEGNRIELWQPA